MSKYFANLKTKLKCSEMESQGSTVLTGNSANVLTLIIYLYGLKHSKQYQPDCHLIIAVCGTALK